MLVQGCYTTFAGSAGVKFATVILLSSVLVAGQSKPRGNTKSVLSDDFAKAATKYVVAVQNFELNATTGSVEAAKDRIESAKEEMEAAETSFGCDEKTADTGNGQLCPEHMTAFRLELSGLNHVLRVKAFLLSESEDRTEVNRSASCLNSWKSTLQRREDREPLECEAKSRTDEMR